MGSRSMHIGMYTPSEDQGRLLFIDKPNLAHQLQDFFRGK